MAIRMPTAWALAAVLVFIAVVPSAGAQPAERPGKKPTSCQVQVLETPTGSLRIWVGSDPHAGVPGAFPVTDQEPPEALPASEKEATFETIDTICPCFFEVFQRWWQNLVRPLPGKTEMEPAGPTCPYLKQKAAPDNQPHDGLGEKQVSVLDNLDKLQQAKKLYDLAEYYQRTGSLATARYYYQLVCDQCPGSRYDQMAKQQMNALPVRRASEAPATEEQEAPMESHLQPALPPLDPQIVQALEKILAEAGDPDLPKLILQTETADPLEEQEPDPALGWLPGSPEDELPILVTFPEDPNPPPEGEEADDDDEDALIPELVPDWNQVFREVIDAVRAGTCVEIDGSNLGHLRILCQKQVGAVTVRIFSDGDGVWRCVVASVDPEASSDLRAAQRAFNDRIGHWIEALSAGEDTPDDEDDWVDDQLEFDDDDIGTES